MSTTLHPEAPTPSLPHRIGIDELPSLVGRQLGTSSGILVDQSRIDGFGEVTEDRQWIHTDPARAASTPLGSTIAHGYLTLSLVTAMLWDVLDVPDAGQIINYGLDKVRFPAPVPVGSELRMDLEIVAVDAIAGGFQVRYRGTAHVQAQPKPVCVAEGLFRYLRAE